MATTTNYSWTTPDDTALVKDGALAIRTLGSSVDTTVKNLNPETTTGAISYRGATANQKTALPIGTAGQVLTVNSGATAPEWKTVAAIPANDSARVNTGEATTSSSYTSLTTSGPAVTVTTGTKALVIVSCYSTGGSASNTRSWISCEVSGATTIAASDDRALHHGYNQGDTYTQGDSMANVYSLTAGSNTFTMLYKTAGGSATFAYREIIVINLA